MELRAEGPDIFSFQLFTPAFCAKAVRELERRRDWVPATVGRGRSGAPVYSESLRKGAKLRLCDAPSLERAFLAAVPETVAPAALLSWMVPLGTPLGPGLLRYPRGGNMRVHLDFDRTLKDKRVISLICYLNDDYRGGRTVFTRHGVTVQPKPGKAVIFPSALTHPHASEPVTSGVKLALVSWF